MPGMKKSTPKHLKIGLVFDDTLDSQDGVAGQVKIIGQWLSQQGHSVSYLVGQTVMTSWADGQVYSLSRNQKVSFNGNRMSIPLPANGAIIREVVSELGLDVLHVQMPHSPFMAQKVVNAADGSTAIVGTFHVYPMNGLAKHGSKLLKPLYLGGLSKFDEVVSVSQPAANFAKAVFGLDTTVIPNTIDVASFKSGIKNKPGQVVFLGRLVSRKGCRQLIEAFRLVVDTIPDARLLIGGKGPQQAELAKLVSKLGLGRNIEFKGFIDNRHRPDFLASGTVACFPSLGGESFGIVLIEAMAAGSGVVIGGNNPGYASVLDQKPQLLFDPGSKSELAKLLIDLLSNAAPRQKLHNWQASEVKRYDINVVGKQIESLYARAIAKRRGNRHN